MRFTYTVRFALLALSSALFVPFAHAQYDGDQWSKYYYSQNATITEDYSTFRAEVGRDKASNLYNPITVTISDPAKLGGVSAYNGSIVNITGGDTYSAYANALSTLNISGGKMDIVNPFDSTSTVNISGGTIRNLQIYDGVNNVTGGTITKSNLNAGTLNWYGGSIASAVDQRIVLSNNSVLNLYGAGLGFSSSTTGNSFGTNYTDYVLMGTLQNGQSVDGVVVRDFGGGYEYNDGSNGNPPSSINFITANATAAPEPGSIALGLTAGIPVLGVILRRSRK